MGLRSPSPYQRAIFEFIESGQGHGVVKATAGSGKTTTLVEAAHRLPLETRACFLAFNRHIAVELRSRLPQHVEGRTIHSLSFSILQRRLDPKLHLDSTKYAKLAGVVLRGDERTQRLKADEHRNAAAYLKSLAGLIMVDLATPEEVPGLVERHRLSFERPALVPVLHELVWSLLGLGYVEAKEGLADYNDLLYVAVAEELKPPKPFDFAFVDEAQDLSKLQLAFVRGCIRPGGRLLFVGDPRQAIYGFSGADTRSIERIIETTGAVVLPLSVSYRCPASHVRLANQFAPEMEVAPGAVVGKVRTISELLLSSQAAPGDLVLCRTNAPLLKAALHLVQQGTPARVMGHDLAGKLSKDALRALGLSLEGWQAKLERFTAQELRRIEESGLAAGAREHVLGQRSDELECLRAVVRAGVEAGVEDTAELMARIEALFRDQETCVTFSTVHKAKGKEAERVFILYPHLMPLSYARSEEARREERCVQFVAVTRSLSELTFVEADNAPAGPTWWRSRGACSTSQPTSKAA